MLPLAMLSLSLYVNFDFLLRYLSFFLNEWSNIGQCIPCRLLGWHIRMMTQPQSAYLQNVSSNLTSLHALSDLISKLVSPTQTCSIIIISMPNHSGIHSLKALVPALTHRSSSPSALWWWLCETKPSSRIRGGEVNDSTVRRSAIKKSGRVSVALFLSVCWFSAFFSTSRCLSLCISHAGY